ncbi:glycosyltransferase family 39 protein [Nocardia sp. NPDC020380]|uniref:glycosyltransferase family 39 protein n=1 Tax=Nocardia sp. NPDC020380 TaxID=3364309 RepID=UPI0037BC15D6
MASTPAVLEAAPDTPAEATPRRWERPALLLLLLGTGLLYLWNLSVSGWGNEFYAAAVQAGTQSYKAWLFGSLDPGNAITVDKPPASLWVMALSGRIFGFNSWSLLVPQALMGVGSVALLYATVRRCAGSAAGLLAGLALALTPVAAMMFRYDNPDALLTLLLIGAAYFTVRAIESPNPRWYSAGTGWLALAGTAIGFAFLTKLMQAVLVLPGLGLAFLIAGAGGIAARISKLATACAAIIVSAGWYLLLVELWPADSRPYIGGSTTNSLWQLAVGYNGMSRLLGGHGGPGGGHGGGPSEEAPRNFFANAAFGGKPGITRLFRDLIGTEASWLLPAALIGLIAGLWLYRRASRTDPVLTGLILWGGWMVGTGLVFSYMSGTIHPYYTVALAPGVAATAAIGLTQLWSRRAHLAARATLAVTVAVTGVWAFVLLHRTPDWLPALRWIVLIGAIAAALALLTAANRTRWTALTAATALVFGLLGTGAYAIETASQAHAGGIPSSGPARQNAFMGPGGFAQIDSPELQQMLTSAGTRWSAAMIGSFDVSSIELRTGTSLMAIGGFGGGDNYPSLTQFQQYVADHQVKYLVLGTQQRAFHWSSGTTTAADQIQTWVKANHQPEKIGNALVYELY